MDEGDHDVAQKDFAAALKAYRGADAIMHVPTTSIEVARTLEQLGMLLEANETALGIARAPAQPGESPAFAAARAAATTLSRGLGPRIPSLELRLPGLPPDAKVTAIIDGEQVPAETTTLPRKVNPGKHTVLVSAPGYASVTRDAVVAEKERAVLEIRLEPAAAPVALVLPTTTPAPPAPAQPIGPSPPNRTALYTALAIGAVGMGTGAVTGIAALADTPSCVNNVCRYGVSLSAAKTFAWASDAGFGVGIVGLGVATVMWLREPRVPARTGNARRVWVTGGATLGGATMGVAGSFQ
jgi:hypothetical protein